MTRIFTFIKLNGAYIGFWLALSGLGLVGLYWAVRLAIVDAIRSSGLMK